MRTWYRVIKFEMEEGRAENQRENSLVEGIHKFGEVGNGSSRFTIKDTEIDPCESGFFDGLSQVPLFSKVKDITPDANSQ